MMNRKGPFRLVYTVLRAPLHWGTRWPLHDLARTILDVEPTDIRIALPGHDFGVARRQLRRLWERRPRSWRGRPIVGFWLLSPLDAPVFVYMKHGDYESTAQTRDEETWPTAEPEDEGPAPDWVYVDPADLAGPR